MPSFNTKRIFEFPEVTTATSSHKILIENSAGLAGYINPVNLVSSVISSISVPLNNIQTIPANTLLGAATAGTPVALDVNGVKSILNYQFDNIGGILSVNNTMVVNSMATITREILTNTNQGAHSSDVHLEIKPSGAQSTQNSPKIGFHSQGYAAASIGLYGEDTSGPIFNIRTTDGTARRMAYVDSNLGIYPYINWFKLSYAQIDDAIKLTPSEAVLPYIYSVCGIEAWFNTNVSSAFAVASHSGGFFQWTAFNTAYTENGNQHMCPYPKSLNINGRNSRGGDNSFYIRNGGYIQIEFCVAPNKYRRGKWYGNNTNWQLGVNSIVSARSALSSDPLKILGSNQYGRNTFLTTANEDSGFYTTSFSPV